MTDGARYRFGEPGRVGVVLGMSLRQTVPILAGVIWLTLMMVFGVPILGAIGPVVGTIIALGRWKRAPLYEVAVPGSRLVARRVMGRAIWTRRSLNGEQLVNAADVPPALRGLRITTRALSWNGATEQVGVIVDRPSGSVSVALPVSGGGFAVASPTEQDVIVAAWGAALAPIARARCAISRVTWQEWSHPEGIQRHRRFLAAAGQQRTHADANTDYWTLLDEVAPFTTAHDVVVVLTADLRRVRGRRGANNVDVATEVLLDETRQLAHRLEAGGFSTNRPWSPDQVRNAVRRRSDPDRRLDHGRSLASAAGHTVEDWGPMAVEARWFEARVDNSWHRSYAIAGWPMLPVAADWMAPLLTVDNITRTITVVLEPVPLAAAAQDANRQLTSIEADLEQKERHGFRLTARERRRQADVETRERELTDGHPLFRHVGIVTVTAASVDELDESCSRIEQAAAQSLIDLRPLAARQSEGWVASLPLARSVRQGSWV